ncbi:hypothetical protein HDV00_004037 [Rhizophlyctis rosea]|nr:hypothetical protein HDV00_004037 [Rhizophlyctis rosea]
MMKAVIMSLALAAGVSAHGAVTSYSVGSTTYQGSAGFQGTPSSSYNGPQWWWPDYNPTGFDGAGDQHSFTTNVRCNSRASDTSTAYTGAKSNIVAAAGSSITAHWGQWTHNPATVAVYLYAVGSDPSTTVPSLDGAGWFKIDEFISSSDSAGCDSCWAGATIQKTLQWTSTIPANLKPGYYVIRHELIARHQAGNPQFYAECANIQITGSGSAFPSSSDMVAIPGTGYATSTQGCSNPPSYIGDSLCYEVNASTRSISSPPAQTTTTTTTTSSVRPTTTTTTTRPITTTTTTTQGGSNTCPNGYVTVTGPGEIYTVTVQAPTVTVTVNGSGSQPTTTTQSNTGTCAARYGQCGGQGWTVCILV